MTNIAYNPTNQQAQVFERDIYDGAEIPEGFDLYALIREPRIEYDMATEQLYRTKSVNQSTKTMTYGWKVGPKQVESAPLRVVNADPGSVSKLNLFLVLSEAGLYKPMVEAISAIPDAATKEQCEIYFQNAVTVKRTHPVTNMLIESLGMQLEQAEALFAEAKKKDLS